MNLRERMADHGFESNESYQYVVSCLESAPGPALRCLNIEGELSRRNTAFGNAMAQAIAPAHVLYHDFTQQENRPPATLPVVENLDDTPQEPPIGAYDRIMIDACALSEAEKTILILDQLQAADFKDHIKLYEFLVKHEWHHRDTAFYANRQNLMVFVISAAPLYHSLQKHSFKVWVQTTSDRGIPFKPADFQLDNKAEPLMTALNRVFENLHIFPTYSEYKKILHDTQLNVRTIEDLKKTIYGWTEGVDHSLLHSSKMHTIFETIIPVLETFIGVEECLELTAAHIPDNT